jgi:hypothetical protein
MSIIRIYPTKSNTIASGPFAAYNSSQNEVMDLWYGGGLTQNGVDFRNSISRHLIYFDLSELFGRFNRKEVMSGSVSSYTLKMRNSVPRDILLKEDLEFDRIGKNVASSYDLIFFPINKFWDEGRGWDLAEQKYMTYNGDLPRLTGYSNWDYSTLSTSWDEPGVYSNPTASTSVFVSQHFSIGDENISANITPIVQDWLTGGTVNYGIGIAFRRDYELLSASTRQIASFHTQKTNFYFKPFIEVKYDQTIKDDRDNVTNNRVSRLFLYTFSGGQPVNFYSSSTVNILNSANAVVHANLQPIQKSKGVYYVDVFMSGTTVGQSYKDVWSGVTFEAGYDLQDITQTFTIQKNYFTSQTPKINEYNIDVYGIPEGGILYNDQLIRVFCDIRTNYSIKSPKTIYNLQYKIMLNEQEEVVPWTEVNQVYIDNEKNNYFDLDTSWLLHNQMYKIFFRVDEYGTSRIMEKTIKFKVLRPFS